MNNNKNQKINPRYKNTSLEKISINPVNQSLDLQNQKGYRASHRKSHTIKHSKKNNLQRSSNNLNESISNQKNLDNSNDISMCFNTMQVVLNPVNQNHNKNQQTNQQQQQQPQAMTKEQKDLQYYQKIQYKSITDDCFNNEVDIFSKEYLKKENSIKKRQNSLSQDKQQNIQCFTQQNSKENDQEFFPFIVSNNAFNQKINYNNDEFEEESVAETPKFQQKEQNSIFSNNNNNNNNFDKTFNNTFQNNNNNVYNRGNFQKQNIKNNKNNNNSNNNSISKNGQENLRLPSLNNINVSINNNNKTNLSTNLNKNKTFYGKKQTFGNTVELPMLNSQNKSISYNNNTKKNKNSVNNRYGSNKGTIYELNYQQQQNLQKQQNCYKKYYQDQQDIEEEGINDIKNNNSQQSRSRSQFATTFGDNFGNYQKCLVN